MRVRPRTADLRTSNNHPAPSQSCRNRPRGASEFTGQRRPCLSGSQSHGSVAAAIRGDADAVRDLWIENRRWVAAVLLAHKPRETDLEDLLQDVAMTFVRTIGRLRDEAMLRPWLRTVAINAARASGRNTKRQRARLGWRITGEDQKDDGGAAG